MNPAANALVAMILSMPALAAGEKLVATNSDVRLIFGFAAPADAVSTLLPPGWQADVATAGKSKDINLRVTLIDTRMARDAEGKALTLPRIAHLSVPVRKVGSTASATMLVVAYSTGGNGGPYGNSVHAGASVARTTASPLTGETDVEEHWSFSTRQGDTIDVRVAYRPGVPVVLQAEDRVHSAAKPDFFRLYRTEQALDALRDPDTDRIRHLVFRASGPVLSRLFDGSERLVRVDAVPWYARQVFVPEP